MSVQAVVFDIGNVLIEWNPERFYDGRIGPVRRKALFGEVDLHAVNLEVDRGADLHSEIEALAATHPDWRAEIRWWRDDWLRMASPAIDYSVRLLSALRQRRIPVFALSNFGIAPFEIAKTAYPFLNEFDHRWISGHMGVIKPDSAIYAALEAESGVAPQGLLFTDDRPENIAAARDRGWQTHLFDGAAGLAQCLTDHGLLTTSEAQ
ncbi:HAD family hydrolase [Roseovarius sp. 2305UL8-3]|uniref:HAD family hydrolase n=1 Tax=Roseovarius conchicola TaxID=3121636 RepID=UPI0035274021